MLFQMLSWDAGPGLTRTSVQKMRIRTASTARSNLSAAMRVREEQDDHAGWEEGQPAAGVGHHPGVGGDPPCSKTTCADPSHQPPSTPP